MCVIPYLQDCLAMGAIFAATDSVATLQVLDRDSMPGLFSLVFGEGVINDAVSVVLLGAVASTAKGEAAADGGEAPRGAFAGGSFVFNFIYLLLTSLVLGAGSGLGIAAALKRLALHDAHQVSNVCDCRFMWLYSTATSRSKVWPMMVIACSSTVHTSCTVWVGSFLLSCSHRPSTAPGKCQARAQHCSQATSICMVLALLACCTCAAINAGGQLTEAAVLLSPLAGACCDNPAELSELPASRCHRPLRHPVPVCVWCTCLTLCTAQRE